jgi:hypothetical protein
VDKAAMRKLDGCRLVLLMTPPLLLLLPVGILTFALERISNSFLTSQTNRDWQSGSRSIIIYDSPNTASSNSTNIEIDVRINRGPALTILGICCLSYLVSAIGVFGIWELRKAEGTPRHQRTWSWLILISNLLMIGGSAGALGYTTSVQNSEDAWQTAEDISKGGPVLTGETWACQIDKFYPNTGWAGAACGTARATRYLLIPMIVSSALVLVSWWMIVRDRGGFKWLSGGKGRYGGFKSVYELEPATPNAPYVYQSAPQWPPQPYQQWNPQAHPQWVPAPMPQWGHQPFQQVPQQSFQQAPQQPVSHGVDPSTKPNQQGVYR